MSAGRHAEIDEVGEAVELGAESRRALEHPREAAIDAIEQGGEDDGGHRPFELAFDRKPHPGQAGAERQQGNEIGQQRAHRNLPEATAHLLRAGRFEG